MASRTLQQRHNHIMGKWAYKEACARCYGFTNKGLTKCIGSECLKAAVRED